MLTNFKQVVKKHWADIVLTICIVLVVLISFGIGRLVVPQNNQASIVIQNPSCSNDASIQQIINQPKTEQGIFVGSTNSDKYHWPNSPWAKKISEKNQIWFSSEDEAQSAGYIRSANFERYAP